MAKTDLGGLTQTREAVRDVRTLWLDDLGQDVRYAFRTLRRSPGFAAVAILTFAIGIGANTAIFSIVNTVLLRPLPYRDPGALVLIEPAPMVVTRAWGLPAWRARAKTVTGVAAFNGPHPGTLVAGGDPEQIDAAEVTWNFLSFLGVSPALGRDFTEADAAPAAPGAAILSHDFWIRRFAATSDVLGRTITLSGETLTIVGVTAPTFRFPATGSTLPASAIRVDTQPDVLRVAGPKAFLTVIGRLTPGATAGSAGAELLAIYRQEAADRLSRRGLERTDVRVAPLQQRLVGDLRQRLWLLSGVVGFVLLVACANVANLLLARASTRHRELAIRAALGAGRARLVRMLLTESAVLALAGSAAALLLTYWLRGAGYRLIVDGVAHVDSIVLDWRVLTFNIAAAAVTGILSGLASLSNATSPNLGTAFNAATTGGATARTRVRRVLLSAEVAVTFVLVVGAALLVQTLWNLNRRERGFDASRVLTVRVVPATAGMERAFIPAFFTDLTARIARLPGVESAAAVSSVPLGGVSVGLGSFAIDGRAPARFEDGTIATSLSSVTPGFFGTMTTPVLAGRDFNDRDRLGSEPVAIANQAFRRRFAPDRNLLGARIAYDGRVLTVVGVVADVPDRSLRDETGPMLFTPLAQMAAGAFGFSRLTLVLRTNAVDPRALAPAVRREIWKGDPTIVIDQVSSMEERLAASIRAERQGAALVLLFALIALLIAAVGVYGVGTYAMVQRRKEIGIRIALGAARRDLIGLVLRQTLGPTLAGLGGGLAAAFIATRAIASRLYGVSALDPAALVVAAVVLAAAALAASYLPARRAMRVDPLVALRAE